MMPTEEEKSRIMEAQMSSPELPLGTAEQFLLTLSSITELEARLKLWAFRLDYESIETVCTPLDLLTSPQFCYLRIVYISSHISY